MGVGMPASQVLMKARSERVTAVLVLLTWFSCPVQKPHFRYWQSQGATPSPFAKAVFGTAETNPRVGPLFSVGGNGSPAPLICERLLALSLAANILSSIKVSRPLLGPPTPPNWITIELMPLFEGVKTSLPPKVAWTRLFVASVTTPVPPERA